LVSALQMVDLASFTHALKKKASVVFASMKTAALEFRRQIGGEACNNQRTIGTLFYPLQLRGLNALRVYVCAFAR